MSRMIARVYIGIDKKLADIIYDELLEHMNKQDVLKAYDANLFEITGEVHITNIIREVVNKSYIISMECISDKTIKVDHRTISFGMPIKE